MKFRFLAVVAVFTLLFGTSAIAQREDPAGELQAMADRLQQLATKVTALVKERDEAIAKVEAMRKERDKALVEKDAMAKGRDEMNGLVQKLADANKRDEETLRAESEPVAKVEEMPCRQKEALIKRLYARLQESVSSRREATRTEPASGTTRPVEKSSALRFPSPN